MLADTDWVCQTCSPTILNQVHVCLIQRLLIQGVAGATDLMSKSSSSSWCSVRRVQTHRFSPNDGQNRKIRMELSIITYHICRNVYHQRNNSVNIHKPKPGSGPSDSISALCGLARNIGALITTRLAPFLNFVACSLANFERLLVSRLIETRQEWIIYCLS